MISLKHNGIALGKLLVGGLALLAGMILGSIAATLAGLRVPTLSTGADQATLNTLLVPISPLLSLTLSRLARGLSGSFPARWASSS